MNPITTHKETKDGIVYTGEVFNDNIFPISQTPIYSKVRINEEKNNNELDCMFFQEKLTKEQIKGQVELIIKHWVKPVKTIEQ